MRKIAIGTLATLFALLSAAVLAVNFVDWNQYRDTVQKLASSALGVQVELTGTIGVALFPRPTLEAETVTLYDPATTAGGAIATARRIDVQLAPLALLRGQVKLENLELVGLALTLVEDEAGAWSVGGWSFGDRRDETAAAGSASEDKPDGATDRASGDTPSIQFEQFRLSDAEITVQQYQARPWRLRGIKLALSGAFPAGPMDWDGALVLGQTPVAISGRLRPVAARDGISLRSDFDIAGGRLSWSGRFGGGDGLVGRAVLEGSNLARFITSVAQATGQGLVANSEREIPFLLDVELAEEGSVLTVASKQFSVNNTRGRLSLTLTETEIPHFTGALALGVFDIDDWGLDLTPAAASVEPSASTSGEGSAANEALILPATGVIDVTVEGIIAENNSVQNIDFTVEAKPSSLILSRFQALLPGSTNLSATGTLDFTGELMGSGAMTLSSSRFPALLTAIGIDTGDHVPPGRLTTARIKSAVNIAGDRWQLGVTDGDLDTTQFSGTVQGLWQAPFLSALDINVGSLNLDAYSLEQVGDEGEANPQTAFDLAAFFPERPIDIDLKIQELRWRGQPYQNFTIDVVAGPGGLTANRIFVGHATGSAQTSASVRRQNTNLVYDLDLRLDDFSLAPLLADFADLAGYARTLGLDKMSGTVRATGPAHDLRVSADIVHVPSKRWSVTGSVNIADSVLNTADLQGNLAHPDLAPILRDSGVDASNVPAELNVAVRKAAVDQPYRMRLGGKLGGGQLITDLSLNGARIVADYSLDHPSADALVRTLGLPFEPPQKTASLSAKGKLTRDAGDWSLRDGELQNGEARLSGNINLSADNILSGDVRVENWTFLADAAKPATPGERPPGQGGEESGNTALGLYSGSLKLVTSNVSVLGQTMSLPNGRIELGDGAAYLAAGEGATLNSQPLIFTMNAVLDSSAQYRVTLDAANIDIAGMMLGSGYRGIISGTGALKLDVSAQGNSYKDFLSTLQGTASLNGSAGALNFLDVPALIADIQQATSGRAFLNLIGNRLRGGQSNFSAVTASLTLDGGVALVETFQASGGWGQLELGGQLNLKDEFMDVSGALSLARPIDAPKVPVTYRGAFSSPAGGWASRALEKFVIADIERRFRSKIFKDLGQAQDNQTGAKAPSAGSAVFESAISILDQIRARQKAAREAEQKENPPPPKKDDNP